MAIMLENNPLIMKQIGDSLKTDNKDWNKGICEKMKTAVYAKFVQNQTLSTAIRATGSKKFVECTEHDTK